MTINFISYKILKNLEYLFLFVLMLTIVYIGYFFLAKNKWSDYITVSISESETSKNSFEEEVRNLELKPYDFYSKHIDSRDIFSNSGVAIEGIDTKSAVTPGQLPANFKIVGIDLGSKSQIIIEDTAIHQTYFIQQDKSQAGISIQSTGKDKIYLNYQGQTIEIDLKGNQVYGSKSTP